MRPKKHHASNHITSTQNEVLGKNNLIPCSQFNSIEFMKIKNLCFAKTNQSEIICNVEFLTE